MKGSVYVACASILVGPPGNRYILTTSCWCSCTKNALHHNNFYCLSKQESNNLWFQCEKTQMTSFLFLKNTNYMFSVPKNIWLEKVVPIDAAKPYNDQSPDLEANHKNSLSGLPCIFGGRLSLPSIQGFLFLQSQYLSKFRYLLLSYYFNFLLQAQSFQKISIKLPQIGTGKSPQWRKWKFWRRKMGWGRKRGGGGEEIGEKCPGCLLGCGRRPEAAKDSAQLVIQQLFPQIISWKTFFLKDSVQLVMTSFLPNYILSGKFLGDD